jgi:hypothetical protein
VVAEVEGGREPIGNIAIPRGPGQLMGIELSHQLRLLGKEPVDLPLVGQKLFFPLIDLLGFGIPCKRMFHSRTMTGPSDKIAAGRIEPRKNPGYVIDQPRNCDAP